MTTEKYTKNLSLKRVLFIYNVQIATKFFTSYPLISKLCLELHVSLVNFLENREK